MKKPSNLDNNKMTIYERASVEEANPKKYKSADVDREQFVNKRPEDIKTIAKDLSVQKCYNGQRGRLCELIELRATLYMC